MFSAKDVRNSILSLRYSSSFALNIMFFNSFKSSGLMILCVIQASLLMGP